MRPAWRLVLGLAAGSALAVSWAAVVVEGADGRSPQAWRELDAADAARFDLGHAVFNTTWLPAGAGAGRRDGLGPLFNSASCDSCHNSRRRGRGPVGDGPAPVDLVIQAGRRLANGALERGHPRFGHVINTDAIAGFAPEAAVSIRYRAQVRQRPDGSQQTLWAPDYRIETPDGQPPPDDLVVMPRMASQAQGAGLLEEIADDAILAGARPRRGRPQGLPAWIDTAGERRLGRFGWQATEPTLADQIAAAFAREMGLTTARIGTIDCAAHDLACRTAAHGGEPEVDADLFEAVLAFQHLESVRRPPAATAHLRASPDGAGLFAQAGCADCHRPSMPTRDGGTIAAYTDLLLHDLGLDLADRDAGGTPVPSLWRTAPLWGLATAHEGDRPVRLLHDGRARSVDEAIGWHGGSAAPARARYERMDAGQRRRLADWVSSL